MTDTNSLSHSKWNCKYHIVFAPKFRRKVIYGKIKADIGNINNKLSAKQKEKEQLEKELKLNILEGIYLLYGEETYLLEQQLKP